MFVKISVEMEDIAKEMDLCHVMEVIDPHIGDILVDIFHADYDWVDDTLAELSNEDYARLFHALADRFKNGE